MNELKFQLVTIEKGEDTNVIIGQSHFIKTVEDLYETLAMAGGGIKFGIAFCEASGVRLIRLEGNDDNLRHMARKNAEKLGTGHVFVICMENGFPIQVLNSVKQVPEVCSIFAATGNPLQVVVAESEQGRGVMGVIDGEPPLGVEGESDVADRQALLRRFGYKR
jgi:adenosine/AMP kinase